MDADVLLDGCHSDDDDAGCKRHSVEISSKLVHSGHAMHLMQHAWAKVAFDKASSQSPDSSRHRSVSSIPHYSEDGAAAGNGVGLRHRAVVRLDDDMWESYVGISVSFLTQQQHEPRPGAATARTTIAVSEHRAEYEQSRLW